MKVWKVIPIERNKRTHMGALVIFPDEGGSPIAEIAANIRRPSAAAQHNARLIAAAPMLLTALDQIRNVCYNSQAYRATDTVLACIGIAEDAIREANA